MRAFLATFLISLALFAGVAGAQPVTSSGQITGTHSSMWVSPGILADGGTAFDSPMSTLGLTSSSNTTFCTSSDRASAAGRNQLCMGATGTGGQLSLQNFGTTPPGSMKFVVNGTSFNFPLGAITTNSPLLPNVQATNYTIATSDCGGAVIETGANQTITLPSPSGFAGGCVISIVNGNTTQPQILSGFPSLPENICSTCLLPGLSIQIWNVNGTWTLLRTQPDPTTHVANAVSGANGCSPADRFGAVDSRAAIQCQITFLSTNFLGGLVYFPCGTYVVAATLNIPSGIVLQGENLNCTTIASILVGGVNSDITVLQFNTNTSLNGLREINIIASQSTTAAQNAIQVGNNSSTYFEHCQVTGGLFALSTNGVGGVTYHCGFSGAALAGGSLVTAGANAYIDTFFDGAAGFTNKYGVHILATFAGSTSGENHFVHTDMSGTWTTAAFAIDNIGSGQTHLTSIFGAILSGPAIIGTGAYTSFVGTWFGSTINSSSTTSIVGSESVSGIITTSGTGPFSCSGNIALACNAPATSTLQASAGNPAGTISSASRMVGVGSTCTITPNLNTRAVITIGGNVSNTVAGDGAQLNLYYGSGTAPANGAATTGTLTTASAALAVSAGNSLAVPFNLGSVVVTGLTPGTAYWFDLALAVITGGTASVTGVWCSAFEL